MQLYTRAASSCSFRIRIALGVKKLPWEAVLVDVAMQQGEKYRDLNPQALVPFLVDGKAKIGQTLAILEYLEEAYSDAPRLLPGDILARARVRAIASFVVADIQPLQNTGLDDYFEKEGVNHFAWKQHWISYRFEGLEKMLHPLQGRYSHGDNVTMADCCLIPQVWNAINRYSIDMSKYPAIKAVYENCIKEAAFANAAPDKQPDFTG
ncbi:g12008 [Coccomyxa viridis]|uniref:G12008 protein n=1 Tax=Coccomyxa viridis TaxID=1274662 RepID=A0ABP1G9A2_9CHLO